MKPNTLYIVLILCFKVYFNAAQSRKKQIEILTTQKDSLISLLCNERKTSLDAYRDFNFKYSKLDLRFNELLLKYDSLNLLLSKVRNDYFKSEEKNSLLSNENIKLKNSFNEILKANINDSLLLDSSSKIENSQYLNSFLFANSEFQLFEANFPVGMGENYYYDVGKKLWARSIRTFEIDEERALINLELGISKDSMSKNTLDSIDLVLGKVLLENQIFLDSIASNELNRCKISVQLNDDFLIFNLIKNKSIYLTKVKMNDLNKVKPLYLNINNISGLDLDFHNEWFPPVFSEINHIVLILDDDIKIKLDYKSGGFEYSFKKVK